LPELNLINHHNTTLSRLPSLPLSLPDIPPNIIISAMVSLVPLSRLLRRTNARSERARLERLARGGINAAALGKRDLTVVALAAGRRAVGYRGAGEFVRDGVIDARFGSCG
jgi:hypothetical protein